MNILGGIRKLWDQRQLARTQTYEELLSSLVDGSSTLKPSEVLELLDANKKSLEQMERDLAGRRELRRIEALGAEQADRVEDLAAWAKTGKAEMAARAEKFRELSKELLEMQEADRAHEAQWRVGIAQREARVQESKAANDKLEKLRREALGETFDIDSIVDNEAVPAAAKVRDLTHNLERARAGFSNSQAALAVHAKSPRRGDPSRVEESREKLQHDFDQYAADVRRLERQLVDAQQEVEHARRRSELARVKNIEEVDELAESETLAI